MHPINETMDVTLKSIREMVDVDTVVGSPINLDGGITIIPVSKVSFGFASGGGEYGRNEKANLGAGGGAGVTVNPVAFIIVSDGNVKVVPAPAPASSSIDRIVDIAPELIQKAAGILGKSKKK